MRTGGMSNVMQYWYILESLDFLALGDSGCVKTSKDGRIKLNLKKIQDSSKLSPADVTNCIITELKLNHLDCVNTDADNSSDLQYFYSLYLLHVLRLIINDVDFFSARKDDLVSEKHRTLVISAIEDIIEYGLKQNLHASFYKASEAVFHRSINFESNFYRTELLVSAFSPLVFVSALYSSETIQDITLHYMAAVHSLFYAGETEKYRIDQAGISFLQNNLQKIWTRVSKSIYYRNLMVLYAVLPNDFKKKIHKDMLLKLWSPGGFEALLFAMQKSKENEGKVLPEVICRIVSQPTYPIKAQQSLVKQILNFVDACPSRSELMAHMGAGLLSIKELCCNKPENKELVQDWLKEKMQRLLSCEKEQITVIEWSQFEELISLLFHIFCTSTIECLPSELLTPYLPLLISSHMQIRLCGKQSQVDRHLGLLILNILNNCEIKEFDSIMKIFAFDSYPASWFHLHHDIVFEENPLFALELRIVQKKEEPKISCSTSNIFGLAVIINESSFSLICFRAFMSLFRLIPDVAMNEVTNKSLQESDVKDKLRCYQIKMDLIKSLELLLHHKNLKPLIIENITEVLLILQDILTAFSHSINQSSKEADFSVVIILLVLIGEIVESCSSPKLQEVRAKLLEPLKLLKKKVTNKNVHHKILSLEKQILCENSFVHKQSPEEDFFKARALIESSESYEHVEGIDKLIKLIKSNEEVVLSNVHIITTLALNTLRSSESYTFLNCVRLFASLVKINASEVLDILVDEYKNEQADTDFRLVVGEALLKVCHELGPLCYNYKTLLINCYMSECRSSIDEFRFSSFSNLSQICRLLSYQVQMFFEELMNIIDCELTTGKYLPAKRAAVMILCDVLHGMDNLCDFEEMLLPIYRALKYLDENMDEKIRIHATNGLEILSEKCKQLLACAIQPPLEKQINVLNLGSKPKKKLSDHIFYID